MIRVGAHRPRPWLLVPLAAIVGCGAGALAAALQPIEYSARGTVVVQAALHGAPPRPELVATTASLVGTSVVTTNVVEALGLHESPAALRGDVHARARRGTAVVDVTVDQPNAIQATRVLQQVLTVFQRVADARLSTGGSPAIATWDVGASASRVGRPFAEWMLVGAGAGAALAALLAAALGGGVPRRRTARDARTAPGGTLRTLERRAASASDPATRAELEGYVDELRAFADRDGSLPASFRPLVEDVFGPL